MSKRWKLIYVWIYISTPWYNWNEYPRSWMQFKSVFQVEEAPWIWNIKIENIYIYIIQCWFQSNNKYNKCSYIEAWIQELLRHRYRRVFSPLKKVGIRRVHTLLRWTKLKARMIHNLRRHSDDPRRNHITHCHCIYLCSYYVRLVSIDFWDKNETHLFVDQVTDTEIKPWIHRGELHR